MGALLLSPFIQLFVQAAQWFIQSILKVVTATTTPDVPAALRGIYTPMTLVGAAFAALFLVVAAALGAIRGDGRSLGRAFGYALTWGLLSAAAPALVGAAVVATDYLCLGVSRNLGQDAGKVLGTAAAFSGLPAGVSLIGALVIIIGALLFTIDLLARDVVILVATSFAPIALAGLIFTGAAGWARVLGRLLAVAILSKFLLIGGAAVAFSVMSSATLSAAGLGQALAAGVILGLLALAPALLLRHAPGGAPAVGRSEAIQSTGTPQAARTAATVTMIRRGA